MTLEESIELVNKAIVSKDANEVKDIIQKLTTGPERFLNVTEAIYSGVSPEILEAINNG